MVDSCRFCNIKVDKTCTKLNNLSAQLIEYQYLDEFYFYFAKSINEIITYTKTSDMIYYVDVIKDNPYKEYLSTYNTTGNSQQQMKKLVQENSYGPN